MQTRTVKVGIVGLGYVGLPLALLFSEQRFRITGFDIDHEKVHALNDSRSYIHRILPTEIAAARANGFSATNEYAKAAEMDAMIICVPTPLNEYREPDLSYIEKTAHAIAPDGSILQEAGVTLERDGDGVRWTRTLQEGESGGVVLESMGGTPRRVTPEEAQRLEDDTARFWRGWLSRSSYSGRWREMVGRSAITLKLMTYAPTGAPVAAPTTGPSPWTMLNTPAGTPASSRISAKI